MPASIWRPMSANGPEKAAMTPTLIVSCAVAGTAVRAIHSVKKKNRFMLSLLQCVAVDSRRDDAARRRQSPPIYRSPSVLTGHHRTFFGEPATTVPHALLATPPGDTRSRVMV